MLLGIVPTVAALSICRIVDEVGSRADLISRVFGTPIDFVPVLAAAGDAIFGIAMLGAIVTYIRVRHWIRVRISKFA